MTETVASTPIAVNSSSPSAEDFIVRWRKSGGAERANYQMFITELCDFLCVDRPEPATDDDSQNAYTFDRLVTHTRPDGSTVSNWIDCYKRGHFILETKQGIERRAREADAAQALAADSTAPAKRKSGHGLRGTPKWDAAMLAARNQAERYARALPPSEGWPPFLIIIDIGHTIELYSEFSLSGKTYVPYPDPQSFRINLKDLADPAICDRLRLVFTDPLTLDPTRHAARITRDVANHLADLSRSLEASGYQPERTANFLMRCIFTMFAEDVELIPANGFRDLLRLFTIETPAADRLSADIFPDLVKDVWHAMDKGVFSAHLKQKLQRFNGGLFAETEVLPLNTAQITLLHSAACCHWREVEPAIFGTLLERALNPKERHKLGAHYTPRAYVERLVLPTVIEPLRDDWQNVLTAAVLEANSEDKNGWKRAVQLCRDFLYQLTQTLVLDPACGTGNFLYVTLEHMKRLEGEVRDAMANFTGSHQAEIEASEFQVDPHQFLGIEINPRAAAIAELVLWIGYLQWQVKALGTTRLPEPVLKNYHNIENRDAVLDYDRKEPQLDPDGNPVTRWDGETKIHDSVTGKTVPDVSASVPSFSYTNPRKPQWPRVDFIVGNPPFLGKGARMREYLGEGYVKALRTAHPDVPESADFVMYWWNSAANELRAGTKRFGLITRNSIAQKFNRQVLTSHLCCDDPIFLNMAVVNHPWVDSADGAAVRIAMTIGSLGFQKPGTQYTIKKEMATDSGAFDVTLQKRNGIIKADLTVGIDFLSMVPLASNIGLACPGVQLSGQGFVLDKPERFQFRQSTQNDLIKRYITGRDLTQLGREQYVIDTAMLSSEELLENYPDAYQWLYDRVKAQRAAKLTGSKDLTDYAQNWWRLSKPRNEFRKALVGQKRYIGSSRTSRHRIFTWLSQETLPESKVLIVALSDAVHLGVLSSKYHVVYSTERGGWHGVGNDPTYNHTECFHPFPFPTPTPEQADRIRDIAERLDAHRKRQQQLHPKLTLTDCYNVLQKLRTGEPLTKKDKVIHDHGLVTVLRQLHDDLDAAVAEAYGWPADLTDQEILTRLVDLNTQRAAEEAQGKIQYLRPKYQDPALRAEGTADKPEKEATQYDLLPEEPKPAKTKTRKPTAEKPAIKTKTKQEKQPWPKTLPEQAKAVQSILRNHKGITATEVATKFQRGKAEWVDPIMQTLAVLGQLDSE